MMARKRKTFAEIKAEQESKKLAKRQEKAERHGLEHTYRAAITGMFKFRAFNVGVMIDRDKATFSTIGGNAEFPIAGAYAELAGGDASQRFTVTRLALAGPLALGMPKRTGHRNLIITAADGQQLATTVRPDATQAATQFMTQFNSLSAALQ